MKILLLPLLLISSMLMASEQYSTEEHVKNPVKIPITMIAQLTKEIDAHPAAACHEAKPHDMFEAEIVNLNKSSKAYVVKPAHMCLCSTNQCPMWLFQIKGKATKLIWKTPAANGFEVLDKQLNGYKKLKETAAADTHGHEAIWSWDRDRYTEIDRNEWTWDAEKKCRFGKETSQLIDGKMVQHTIRCTQD